MRDASISGASVPDFSRFADWAAAEWAVIQGAPLAALMFFVIAFGLSWICQRWAYRTVIAYRDGKIAHLEERVRMRDDQLNNKLQTTPPDEAEKLIAKLQDTIKRTIGSEWAPLTAAESETLAREVALLKKRNIQVMYVNSFGKDLARTLRNAFRAGGWDATMTMGSGFEAGIFVGWSPSGSAEIKSAVEKTTGLTVANYPSDGALPDDTDMGVFLAVGTNPA